MAGEKPGGEGDNGPGLRDLCKEFEQVDADYRQDLAVHLYMIHMLHTASRTIPSSTFTSWPKHREQVPCTVPGLEKKTRAVHHNDPSLPRPDKSMLQLFRPCASGKAHLENEIARVFEHKVNQKIFKAGGTPSVMIPVTMDSHSRRKIRKKLATVIDRLIHVRSMHYKHTPAQSSMLPELDWQDVSAAIPDLQDRLRLNKLFSIKLAKPYRPVETMAQQREDYSRRLLEHRDSTLRLLTTTKRQKIARRMQELDEELPLTDTFTLYTKKDREADDAKGVVRSTT